MIIARTIIEQINALDPWALRAYGAIEFKLLSENDKREGGVQFKVNGLFFKGYVKIELEWSDEYKITFINFDTTVVKTIKGIHFPELVEILDYVETGK